MLSLPRASDTDACYRNMLYGAVCSVCTCCDLEGASCPRYRFPIYAALYVWDMILKLLHVPGSCCCKMTPSVRAPLELRLPAWILYPGYFFWREPEKNLFSPERISFHTVVTVWFSFPSTDISGFCVKKGFNMVENSPGSMISSATGIFLSFLHAKVGRERLVYFIVKLSYHIVLNLYFINWIGSNLRRTEY